MRGQQNIVSLVLLVAISIATTIAFHFYINNTLSETFAARQTLASPVVISSAVYDKGTIRIAARSDFPLDSNDIAIYVYSMDGVLLDSVPVSDVSCSSDLCFIRSDTVYLSPGEYVVSLAVRGVRYATELVVVKSPILLRCNTCDSCNSALLDAFRATQEMGSTATVVLDGNIVEYDEPCISLSSVSAAPGTFVIFDMNGNRILVHQSGSYVVELNEVSGLVVKHGSIFTGDSPCSGAVYLNDSNTVFRNVFIRSDCGESSHAVVATNSDILFDLHTYPSTVCESTNSAFSLVDSSVSCDCNESLYVYAPVEPTISCSCMQYSSNVAACFGSPEGT